MHSRAGLLSIVPAVFASPTRPVLRDQSYKTQPLRVPMQVLQGAYAPA